MGCESLALDSFCHSICKMNWLLHSQVKRWWKDGP